MAVKYIEMAQLKYESLLSACSIWGYINGDLWKAKRPLKYFTAAESHCKVSNNLLLKNPVEFQNLRHPAGCSLQYIAILARLLNSPDWYSQFMNTWQENPPENLSLDISGILSKLSQQIKV